MTRRGKVLRDTTSGPGLLIIEGQQYRFSREQTWKSAEGPRSGQVVEVELDDRGEVCAITVVPTSQLTQEQAEAARRNENPIRSFLATISLLRFIGAALLAAAWLIPTALSIQVPFPGKLELTFWQTLGLLNSARLAEFLEGRIDAEPGLYGFAAAVALAGAFLPHIWKDKRALLGGLLPLAFMIVVGVVVRSHLQQALGSEKDGIYSKVHASLGLGAYLSILVSLYFVFVSARGWMAARRAGGQPLHSPQRKAA